MVARVVQHVFAHVFVRLNKFRTTDWMLPDYPILLNGIADEVLNYPTTAGRTFAKLLRKRGMALVVGIVSTPAEDLQIISIPPDSAFSSLGQTCNARTIEFRATADKCRVPNARLFVPECRLNSLTKHCALPSGRAVVGPYLVVAAYEPATGLVVRLRLFPVWISSAGLKINIVRSDAERGLQDAVFLSGGIGYSPQTHREMAILQLLLGHRWRGDILTYWYIPDLIVFPVPGEFAGLVELYAIRKIKRYDQTKDRKDSLGRALDSLTIRYYGIDARKGVKNRRESEAHCAAALASAPFWRSAVSRIPRCA